MTGRNSQGGGIIKGFLWLILIVGLFGGALAGFGAYRLHNIVTTAGPLSEEKIIWIKSGMGVSAIGTYLEEEQVITSPLGFKVLVRLHDAQSDLQAGEYLVPAGASITDVVDILVEGKPYLRSITFPEGLTTRQIMALINEADKLEGEMTLDPAEGELLPETYSFARGDSRDSILTRMLAAQEKVIEELWENRATDLPFETIEEAIILASVVEKETGIADERPLVASVFVNRLRKNMRLQSDPTVIYGLTGGEPLGRGIRASELRKETPYNTYVISGLPPTPIANPGRDSIAAVLNPAETDYIFFVADGTGRHAFATTLAEHNANVRKWRQIERERNNN